MTRKFNNDDRGISTLVSHVLAIGITSVIVVGLLVAGNAYLNDQKEIAAQEELGTVANRLAADVSQADRLSNRSANVTLWATYQERIGGSSYEVSIDTGPECDSNVANACILVASNQLDVEQRVPIRNDTTMAINQTAPGRFQITALSRGSRTRQRTIDPRGALVEENMRLGVGSDVERDSLGQSTNLLNTPPTNLSLRIDSSDSSYPQAGNSIRFEVRADDFDGEIEEFRIEWDDPTYTSGPYVESGLSADNPSGPDLVTDNPTHTFSDPGTYNLTLVVVDDDGRSTRQHERINISGLQLQSMSRTDTPEGYIITMNVRNRHDQAIDISSLFMNTDDDFTDRLEFDSLSTNNNEVQIDVDDDGTIERQYDAAAFPTGQTIPESGLFTGPQFDRAGPLPQIPANTDAEMIFRGVNEDGDDRYTVNVNYLLNGNFVTSRYIDVAPGSPPSASFTVSDSTPDTGDPVTFTSTSTDEGSITSVDWSFGDGSTGSGTSATHSYGSTGTYTVSMTVTDDDGNTDTATQNINVGGPLEVDTASILIDNDQEGPPGPPPTAGEIGFFDGEGTGYLEFEVENIMSSDVTIDAVTVDVLGGGTTYDNIREAGTGYWDKEVLIYTEDGNRDRYDEGGGNPLSVGTTVNDFDITIEHEDFQDRAEIQFQYFRNSADIRQSVADEDVEVTFRYDDGSTQTIILSP